MGQYSSVTFETENTRSSVSFVSRKVERKKELLLLEENCHSYAWSAFICLHY